VFTVEVSPDCEIILLSTPYFGLIDFQDFQVTTVIERGFPLKPSFTDTLCFVRPYFPDLTDPIPCLVYMVLALWVSRPEGCLVQIP